MPDYVVENINGEKVNHLALDSEVQSTIRRFITRQMARIMLLLLDHTMTNKEIAERMNLTSSALSNILQRMKKCEVELLSIEKKDKYVMYSLTSVAHLYTEMNLVLKDKKDLKLIQINETETVELTGCRNALVGLKERLGEDWDVEFPRRCFLFYENGQRGEMPEADTFFEKVEDLIRKEQLEQLEILLNELENETCRKSYLRYIEKYISIRKLCFLDAENWKIAYRFIDDIFCGDEICISYDFLANSGDLSKEEIIKMVKSFSEIIKQSQKEGLSKKGFLEVWEKYFYPHEKLAYFIAEKYRNSYCN
ncbi:MAG: winged helix-turn-helix transcriptional regulator [Lachnospiraceae bacterium]|nr:winged helix-turn-helix transcriptional regulator [Lachnospiraceae bacterium]